MSALVRAAGSTADPGADSPPPPGEAVREATAAPGGVTVIESARCPGLVWPL